MQRKPDLVTPPNPETLDTEAWSATKNYKCLCCNDTGYVVRIERVLESHSIWSRPILCTRLGCTGSQKVQNTSDICDKRLTPNECQELHEIALEDWRKTEATWHEQRQLKRLQSLSKDATKSI